MQMKSECEIKKWLITPAVSIWLRLQHSDCVVWQKQEPMGTVRQKHAAV